MYLCSHQFLVHPQRIHHRFQCLQRKQSPPFLSCTLRNTCGLLSTLSRGTDKGCSVAPSMTSRSSNETPPIFFSGSSKVPSLANVLVVTGVVSIGFVSPALGIFSEPFSSAKACSTSFFCPRASPRWQCRPRGLTSRFLGIPDCFSLARQLSSASADGRCTTF